MTHNTTTATCQHEWLDRGEGDDQWQECWLCGRIEGSLNCHGCGRPWPEPTPAPACSALWSRNMAVSCHVTFPHTVHRGSGDPDAPSWGDGECVPGTLTAGRGGR